MRPGVFVAGLQLFERHVQFEDFFQQLGRHVFGALFADGKAFFGEQVFGALDGISEGAVAVVQNSRGFQRFSLFGGALAAEIIGMPLAAEVIEALLQVGQIEASLGSRPKKRKKFCDRVGIERARLRGERGSAAAAFGGVRIMEDEAGLHERIMPVERHAVQENHAFGIDENAHIAFEFKDVVARARLRQRT